MKRNYIPVNIICFLLAIMLTIVTGSEKEQNANKLFKKARKYCLNQQWINAEQQFSQLIEDYPASKYQDDAQFWVGYCLEKNDKSPLEAFLAFDRLISEFPKSPWADDAVFHQLSIAEKYAKNDKTFYLPFLVEKLSDPNPEIKQQTALALGRLGDKRALPILKTMKTDKNFGELAQTLITKIEERQNQPESSLSEDDQPVYLDIIRRKPAASKKTTIEKPKKYSLFFPAKRYKQYQSLLRKDNNWEPEELISFGLWQILPPNQFEQYNMLDGYDQKEWLRKYWKMRDPTPLTEVNERRQEFERRVNYAYAHYGEFWNNRHFKYLRNQYIRHGWPHAPWDARGELYIKYGEPDAESPGGFHLGEWIYYRYNVDFYVKHYMTNIYGNAISPGPMSRFMHRHDLKYIEAEFIYNTEFKYEHKYNADPIKKFKLGINKSQEDSTGKTVVSYEIPIKEFKMTRNEDKYEVRLLEKCVIFNEDLREVYRQEKIKTLSRKTKNELKKLKLVRQTIDFNLEPGAYHLVLRLKDLNSKKLGIYRKEFALK